MQRSEPKSPPALNELQEWFGGIISQPLANDSSIQPYAPNKKPIREEAKRHVVKSPTLQPHERLEIYNQQYWWRLINTLHDFFPFLIRLFGYSDFNQTLAIPYILDHRPYHWSLNSLGEKLPNWIRKNYKENDLELVYQAAILDEAFHQIFFKKKIGKSNFKQEEFLTKPLFLQPHLSLHELPFNLFAFRKELLQNEVDYWLDNPFPELKKGPHYFKLFLNLNSAIIWKEIEKAEFLALNQLREGLTIDGLCEWLETQPKEIQTEAEKSMQAWFKEWTLHGLITLDAR